MTVTRALYTEDAYRRDCEARVVAADPSGVVLDQTVFYPLGGGQPGDTGWLQAEDGRRWRVGDTRKGETGAILHLLEGEDAPPVPGASIRAEIDWERRYAHMRMHTCLHLLGAVLRYGVTGGQVGAEKSRLDFDTQDEIDKARVTDAVNALIMANQPVTSRWITDAELDAQPELVRTLSVQPPRGVGKIRLLEIRGVDLQPCGGTHVAATGEIGPIEVRKVESKGKRNKRVVIALAS
jgi:misacylated tRNA(Ala) deacylase